MEAQALLAPFDPLIWQRERVEALFGARIRLELYTPREKRTHGYYVLPFLLGDRIVARVDLKADRAASMLRVLAAHAEAGVSKAAIVEPLAIELRLMAAWLGLERVKIGTRWRPCAAAGGCSRGCSTGSPGAPASLATGHGGTLAFVCPLAEP